MVLHSPFISLDRIQKRWIPPLQRNRWGQGFLGVVQVQIPGLLDCFFGSVFFLFWDCLMLDAGKGNLQPSSMAWWCTILQQGGKRLHSVLSCSHWRASVHPHVFMPCSPLLATWWTCDQNRSKLQTVAGAYRPWICRRFSGRNFQMRWAHLWWYHFYYSLESAPLLNCFIMCYHRWTSIQTLRKGLVWYPRPQM